MAKWTEEFKKRAVEKALNQGIKPTVRELKVSRNTLRNWMKQRRNRVEFPVEYHRPRNRLCLKLERAVISMKEKEPQITLKEIQKNLKEKENKILSIKAIHKVLERYGMGGKCYFPFKCQNTPEIQKGLDLARILLEQGEIEKSARLLNSLPALSDFSILEKIPSELLSLRRQAEQLEILWGTMSMEEMYEKAKELRIKCVKEKLCFTEIFLATLEMNALNFLGYPDKVYSLYKKYSRYLPNLYPPLKYIFLLECFISFVRIPAKCPEGIFKKFPYYLERFCKRLPEGNHRIQWYDAISTIFQITGRIDKSLEWMKKLFQELPQEHKKDYFPEYLSLLANKGEYSEIIKFNESFEGLPTPLLLRATLSHGNALLGIGKPEQALGIVLQDFYKAEKEHLAPAMAGFAFFISSCYAALKETKKAKRYLKMSLSYSKKIVELKKFYSLLLGLIPPISKSEERDYRVHLASLYLLSCKSLRKRDYIRAFKFAKKKGLLGFLHRIILLHPSAVINLIKKGKETYIPDKLLNLPVFKEKLPMFKLFLLEEKERLFYGDRKITISPGSKDFHLLVYLFLNRKKTLEKEKLFTLFYRKAQNPSKSLIKALSRIRKRLNLPEGVLTLRKEGILLDTTAKIDLEEFEEKYKVGRISEKVGELGQALKEYKVCFDIYKKSPFEKMGYYYNFAEDRRGVLRYMFENLSKTLIKDAEERGDIKRVKEIKEKLKRENLLF